MKRTKFSQRLRRLTVKTIAAIISLTVILSTVTVLGLVSFAEDKEQMLLLSADIASNDVVIPIPNSTFAKTDYYKLTFKAKVLKGTKPIVGIFNVKQSGTTASPKYAYQAKPEFVNNAYFDGTLDMTGSAPQLYTNYDEESNTFTAVFKMEYLKYISNSSDADHNGIAGLLTIGNTEYGDGGEKDNDLEFVFARPKIEHMKKVDGVWTTESANGIELPELKGSAIDISKAYAYTETAYSKANIKNGVEIDGKTAFICAPLNKYSTLAEDLLKITQIDYNDSLSTTLGHNFIYVEEVEPTVTSKGMKAYYTCNCGNCDGKYYASETENSLIEDISTLEIPATTEKMIVVEKNNSVSNIAVPLELKKAVNSLSNPTVVTGGSDTYDVYLKLKFKARMFTGTKPIIGVLGKGTDGFAVTYKENVNNLNDSSYSDLSCNYNPATLEYNAVIKAAVKPDINNKDLVITIGNAEHDGKDGWDTTDFDVSFAMTEPELYILDPVTKLAVDGEKNLLSSITDYNTIFDDSNVITSVQSLLNAKAKAYTRDGADNTVLKADTVDNFFNSKHNLVEVPYVAPTAEKDGSRAYYYCKDCTVEGCCFAGKKYLDKGYTEVTDAQIVIKKYQMITISADNNTNVFVPLDLKGIANEKHFGTGKSSGYVYVKLTFDAKMIEGEKPIVSRIRGSSNLGGDYAFSEPDYADNTNETPAPAGQEPVLYSKFDKYTGKYEAVLKINVGTWWSTNSNGLHDAILIGHSEHNGAGYKESDTSISFSFANPELYLMDIATGEVDYSTGNLLPSISEDNLNFGKNYIHNDNPCKAENNIMSAPKGMWSIDGSPSNVAVEDITKDYFKYAEFVYHPQVDPTPTTYGTKAYYTCSTPNTEYYGNKYWDKGKTLITDENDIVITYSKMITIKSGSRSNVFIPLDLSKYLKSNYKDSADYSYVRLTFKARMLNGEKPIVSRIRGDKTNGEGSFSEPNYVDNADDIYDGIIENENSDKKAAGPDLYCNFNADTGIYTAIIRIGVGKSWATLSSGVHDAILIGNAEHNGNGFSEADPTVSFTFTSPELYFVDAKTGETDYSTGNLIAPICEETLNKSEVDSQLKAYNHKSNPYTSSDHILTAPKNMWSTDGDPKYVEYSSIDDERYFDYRFVYVPGVDPTITKAGHVAYYECVCGDPLCKYNGKKYSDKGMKEITNINLGKAKMITIEPGSNDNVFIPLNLNGKLKSNYADGDGYSYVMLTFKARMYTGLKPIVSRVRGDLTKKDSDGNSIDGSHAEKNYVDNDDNTYDGNEDKNTEGTVKGPDLYCKYDEKTNSYVAVIRLGVGKSWATLSSGIHDAILIGHSEHNGGSFTSESDQTASFSFTQPELYFIDITKDISTEEKLFEAVDKATGNLIAPVCDETTTNIGETYEYTGDPTISPKHLLSAPQDMWSIDSKNNRGVKVEDIPNEKYFTHYFVKTEGIRPTETAEGQREYYTCACGDPTCEYKDKKYSDKGITEIDDIKLSKTKMILLSANDVGKTTISNIFVPISLKSVVKNSHKDSSGYSYVKLKFKARIISGSYPIVSRIRGSSDLGGEYSYSEPGYADNYDHIYDGIENKNASGSVKGPDLYTDYNPDTMMFTAIIRIQASSAYTTLSNGVHDAILIGNAEHNGNSTSESDYNNSFIFSEPELYLLNASTGEEDLALGNLMPPICDETINTEKTYSHSSVANLKVGDYTYNPCILENHVLSAPKDKWSIDGNADLISTYEIPDGYFESSSEKASKITISNGASDSIISTTAKLKASTNYKVDIDYTSENGGKLNVGYMLLNGSNQYVNAAELGVAVENTIDNVEGKHYAAVFTMPASGSLGTKYDNFKLLIGSVGGNVEFTNVTVRPISISGAYDNNVLLNGDFRRSYNGSAEFDKTYPFWNVENAEEVAKITSEKGVEQDDFADTTPKAIFVNGSSGRLTTEVSLKPDTEYVLKFGSKYESDIKAKPYVALNTTSGAVTEIGKYSNDVADMYNTVYKFKTPSNMAGGLNANVGVNVDSKDIVASFSGFELYELSSLGVEQGENYISDPYLLGLGTKSSIWEISNGFDVTDKTISVYHFRILKPNLLIFSGRNGMDSVIGEDGYVKYAGNNNGYLENTATVKKGVRYIFTLNYKFAGTGYDLGEKTIGPELLINTSNGFVPLVADKTISDDEYKETYIFTAPDEISETQNNFKFRFNVTGAMTSGYLANVSIREYNGTKAIGEELMENGNFSTRDATGWTLSQNSGHFYQFNFTEIPKNFFSKTNPIGPSMIIYRDPSDYSQFRQHLMVKPDTNYELEYETKTTAQKFEDKPSYFTIAVNEYNKDSDGEYILKSDGRNVDSSNISMPTVYKTSDGKDVPAADIARYANTTRITYDSRRDSSYKDKFKNIIRFTTSKDIRTTGDGNILVRLYMRSGTAGFWGQVKLYELDSNGNRTGNNLILNGDFSCGLAGWSSDGEYTIRVVEQPDNFFTDTYNDTPSKMVYSNGSESNKTYGNTFNLKPGQTYYFTGNYVNMNSQGITPEIIYQSITGEYKTLQTELYYNADRYYFEIKFEVPEDALVVDGLAKVKVQITNNENGKGYFHSLMLSEGSKYKNLFDEVGFVGEGGNYALMDYDPNVFVFYNDDSNFDDGDWSGEARLTASDAKGIVVDDDGNGVSGIKMILTPGNISSVTNASGNYSFKNLKPGVYSLYLVSPKTKERIFCLKFTVEESKSINLPLITYSKVTDSIETDGEVNSKSRSVIQCLLFDEDGNRLSDIPIFIEDNGYAITNKKGIATFDNLQNFGAKKIYIYLDNGKKYVFRKVNVVEGKGTRVKLMFAPDSDNLLLYILIFGGIGLLLIGATTVVIILLVKKKTKDKKETIVSP